MTLVLLHALGVDATMFDDLRARLAALGGPDTLAPDLPGHGDTAPLPVGAGTTEQAAWVATWIADELDRCGLAGPVDLLGVSLGGLLAQELAATRPDLVRRLVVVDAVAVYPDAMRTMWHERAAGARADGLEAYVGPTLELWFTEALRTSRDPRVEATRRTLEATSAEGYARACELLAGADLRPLLADIEQPTLVVCGRDDAPPFRSAVAEYESALTDVRTCWLPGRHAALLESAAEAVGPIHDFLRPPTPEEQP